MIENKNEQEIVEGIIMKFINSPECNPTKLFHTISNYYHMAAHRRYNSKLQSLTSANEALKNKLDQIAVALGIPPESWKIAGCEVMAHQITSISNNAKEFFNQTLQLHKQNEALKKELGEAKNLLRKSSFLMQTNSVKDDDMQDLIVTIQSFLSRSTTNEIDKTENG